MSSTPFPFTGSYCWSFWCSYRERPFRRSPRHPAGSGPEASAWDQGASHTAEGELSGLVLFCLNSSNSNMTFVYLCLPSCNKFDNMRYNISVTWCRSWIHLKKMERIKKSWVKTREWYKYKYTHKLQKEECWFDCVLCPFPPKLISHIEEEGLSTEGLLRIPGAATRVKVWQLITLF